MPRRAATLMVIVLTAVLGLAASAAADEAVPVLNGLYQHGRIEVQKSEKGRPPSITPAFVNTRKTSVSGVLMKITVRSDHERLTLPTTFSNCFHDSSRRTAYCELEGTAEPGHAYETDAPFRALNSHCCEVDGTYSYWFAPLDQPWWHTEDYRTAFDRGTGPALGFSPITIGDAGRIQHPQVYAPCCVRFRSAGYGLGEDLAVKGVTLRGAVGQEARAYVSGTAPRRYTSPVKIRIELPEGTSLMTRPADLDPNVSFCAPERPEDPRHLVCTGTYDPSLLRVRIDKWVPGAEGRVSITRPAHDPEPENNSRPLTLEVVGPDGTVLEAEWYQKDSGLRVLLAAAAAAALLLLTGVLTLVRRHRRAHPPGGPEQK
ncbi:hypothetical protein [Streptomyces sp. NPDC003023]|uniref:hypothetical protein n=1 Tax=Streptomyces sp. NPDC003023 TaxID=3364675 RepID=UPI0036C5D6EB